MSIIILGLSMAVIGGAFEAIAAFIRKPRAKAHRHKAATFGYYWGH